MDKRNDGGHAFPVGETMLKAECGMTLRDYFAAHAPAEPQGWFCPVMDSARPKATFRDAEDNAANAAEISRWDCLQAQQRLIQWPYAWADSQLKERERGSAE